MSSYSGTRDKNRLGRMLMSIRSRIRQEEDVQQRRRLLKREVQILLDLEDSSAAVERCLRIISGDPEWIQAHSIMADVYCRIGEWSLAEDFFSQAADRLETSGHTESSVRIRTGPLFRLSEARGDLDRCLLLADSVDELSSILRVRVRRMKGEAAVLPCDTNHPLAARLLQLEYSWKGEGVEQLLDTALDWESGEPEWRWRFIVESIDIWKRMGFQTSGWRGPVRKTAAPVLDPRFSSEWRVLGEI